MFEKGDIVRTERGYFGKVNWSDSENVGVTYVEGSRNVPSLGCMTFKCDEITLVKSKTQDFWKETFHTLSDEERRREISRERAIRATQPSEEEKVIRKSNNYDKLFAELQPEELAGLKELIRSKGGKI